MNPRHPSTSLIACAAAAVLIAAGAAPGCRGQTLSGTGANSGGPKIIATTGMVADVVREVAGDRAQVTGLIGAGVDPHLFKPTRSDMAALSSAAFIFYNGLLLEGRMTDALRRLQASGKPVCAVTESIKPEYLLESEQFPGHHDPHVWMDPAAWKQTVGVVAGKLSAFDAPGQSGYRDRAAAYSKKLEDLDAYAVKVLGSVPPERRILVTAHDAFNYFGRRFGFEVVGIQGLSTESEAGVQDIERIVSLLVERRVPAVFVESTVSDRNVRALIEGAAARGQTVVIGGRLFSDAMGAPGTYEGTYEGMIDHNVTVIARALGGQAAPGGMHGRLAGVE